MKRQANIIDVIKVIVAALMRKRKYVIVCCNYCNSTDIKFKTGKDELCYYESEYTCNRCGATCRNLENWTHDIEL